MAYLYPYGDSQQLNLSWFLARFKDLYEYVMNLDPGEASMDTILSRFTDQYDPSTTYVAGDYCIFDGYIYKANQTTSGMFNSGAWDPALPVNDIQGLRILISQISQALEDLEEAAVTNVQYTPGPATANGLLQKKVNGSASTVMTVDKEPTNNSQNPVKSGAVYKELTEIKGPLSTILPFDTLPTNGSTKGVTSGAVYTALNAVLQNLELVSHPINAIDSSLIQSGSVECYTFGKLCQITIRNLQFTRAVIDEAVYNNVPKPKAQASACVMASNTSANSDLIKLHTAYIQAGQQQILFNVPSNYNIGHWITILYLTE